MARVITEEMILAARKAGQNVVHIDARSLITPLARDAAKKYGIRFETDSAAPKPVTTPPTTWRPDSQTLIILGADHGGFELKTALVDYIGQLGYGLKDLGTFSSDPVDYPDIALAVAEAVAADANALGIIVDGAGTGSAIVANKVPGIRAACCNDLFTAVNSREHNGANILTLGGRVIGIELAKKIVKVWLETCFGGGRHRARLEKVERADAKYRRPK